MKIKLLKDKYRLNRVLDEDEHFIIFQGEVIDRPELDVQVHVLKNRYVKDSALVQRITQEYQGQEKLNHPGIVRVHDIDYFKNVYFVVKDRCEGRPLDSLIREGYEFSLSQVVNIVTQLTRILGHAFKEGVRLRTLMPVDILLTPEQKVKILRFRTPRAMQDEGDKAPGMSTDLFFLGGLLYELVEGESPFALGKSMVRGMRSENDIVFERSLDGLDGSAQNFFRRVIYRCLTSDLDQRYGDYNALLQDLQRFIQDHVDSREVRQAMEMAPPSAPQPLMPSRETEPQSHIARMADLPEEAVMAMADRERDARDLLFTADEMDEPGDNSTRLAVFVGLLLVVFTILVIYIFY